MKVLRMISGNLVIVASLVLGTSRILDWYNPFMDFGGHTIFMIYVLAGAAAVFAASNISLYLEKERRKQEKLQHKERERHRSGGKTAAGSI